MCVENLIECLQIWLLEMELRKAHLKHQSLRSFCFLLNNGSRGFGTTSTQNNLVDSGARLNSYSPMSHQRYKCIIWMSAHSVATL